jgi:bifunctional non-homologous end joining protein LigD
LFPEVGITKQQVLDYYRHVAPKLLPFLHDRPVTLERLPEGLGEGRPRFWQKNTPAHYPDWIERINLPSEQGKPVHYVLVKDLASLLFLVNQGALTFHISFSRAQHLAEPDFVLFDLDPGEASFMDAVAVAKQLRHLLRADDREGFVKTSGKTGLHVLVSWREQGGFDAARAWALQMAQRVATGLPDQATVERSKAKRGRRVYVDVLQNALGHHVVPPYVLRAVPEATVSMPLAWRELTVALDPRRFTLDAALRRWARQQKDPLARLVKEWK